MRRKLLLTLALAVLGAVVVASTGSADSVGPDTSAGGNAPVAQRGVVPACSNGLDDDGDGLVDLDDPGCSGPLDTSEYNPPPPACSNGKDDDGDGLVDLADPGCSGPSDDSEFNAVPACSNGKDDDGDGLVDLADPGCSGPGDTSEFNKPPACSNGKDDDGDGRVDLADPGCSGPGDTSEFNKPPACSNGKDDDGDGRVDLADPGCSGPGDTSEFNRRPPACSNGKDDDGDGRVDLRDPGCSGPSDDSEYNRPGGGGGGGGGGTGGGRLPKEFFGIAWGSPTNVRDLQKQKKAKVRTERISAPWWLVERRQGHYNWAVVDTKVRMLAANGIRPIISIYGTPAWAMKSNYPGTPPLKGKAKKAFKRFVKKAVRRYKKRGVFWKTYPELKKKPVKAWQVWNEPNLPKYFARKGTSPLKLVKNAPKKYAKLVKTADKGINKADKKAKLVLAGLSGNPKKKKYQPHKFLKKFLKVRKIKKRFSAAALHPYAPSIKQYKKRLKKVRKVLDKKGAKKKGIWLTEVGWGSGKPDKNGLNKGRKGQARMLKKSFKLTLKKRKKWNIERLYWFDWRDYNVGNPICGFCHYAGLLDVDGTRKPAMKQFKRFTRKQRAG